MCTNAAVKVSLHECCLEPLLGIGQVASLETHLHISGASCKSISQTLKLLSLFQHSHEWSSHVADASLHAQRTTTCTAFKHDAHAKEKLEQQLYRSVSAYKAKKNLVEVKPHKMCFLCILMHFTCPAHALW